MGCRPTGDDSLIGHVSLGPAARTYWTLSREDPDSLYVPWEVDLVCVLDEPAWDQGYDVEACKAMLAHAFEDMRLARIVNHLDQDDLRAISLAEGLGFRVEPNQHPHYRGLVATLANTSL